MAVLLMAVSLLIIGVTAAVIAWPLFKGPDEGVEEVAATTSEIAADPLQEMIERRDTIYQALRELRFDHEVGKVSEADYQAFESQLKAQAVAVLKEIDALQEAVADEELDARLEAEIAALRRNGGGVAGGAAPVTAGGAVRFCPKCGTKARSDDRFCGSCGTALA